MGAVAVALFAFMLPAVPAVERMRSTHSMWHYFLGFLLSLFLTYATIGFLNGVFKGRFDIITFSVTSTIVGSMVGYYLVRRASQSFRDGFLSNPISVTVCRIPAALSGGNYLWMSTISGHVCSGIYSNARRMVWHVPFKRSGRRRMGLSRCWNNLKRADIISPSSRPNSSPSSKTTCRAFMQVSFFFLINLVIARALNHPTYSLNSVIFEADAGPWMSILGYPEGHDVNRAVHPLVLITLRPLVSFVRFFLADKWYLAPMIVVAAMNGLCVLMGWLFVKRATQKSTYAFLFALMLGTTAAHLLFGSLTETYVFGMTSLIFFFRSRSSRRKTFFACLCRRDCWCLA